MRKKDNMNEFDTRNLRNPSPYTKILAEENKNKRLNAPVVRRIDFQLQRETITQIRQFTFFIKIKLLHLWR